MKILVTVKQVPDTTDIKVDKETGRLMREGAPSIVNPDDLTALEAALRLRDQFPQIVITVLSMGPRQAEDALNHCLAMGADEAVLLTDRAFGGADTWATSFTLARAVERLGGFDAVIAGRQAIDGDTAQVGPQLAEHLCLTQVTYVQKLEFDGRGTFIVEKQTDYGHEVIEVHAPCLLTVVKELNQPRLPTMDGIIRAYDCEIRVVTADDLGCEPDQLGAKGSPTRVVKSFTPDFAKEPELMEGQAQDKVDQLFERLLDRNMMRRENTG